jgi:predicted solute-binding protein
MKRIGILPHLFVQPLLYGLKRQEDPPLFELLESHHAGTSELAIKLRQSQLDGAFLSPIDYARDSSRYRIIPSVGVLSEGESSAITLLFRENLRRVSSIAVDPSAGSEVVLAHLIFLEKYDSVPKIVPTAATGPGGLEAALGKADAVLLLGDSALEAEGRRNKLDLVAEWGDMTGLPYIHGFWVAPGEALSVPEAQTLIESGRKGASNLESVSRNTGYLRRFRYEMDEGALSALAEFFRMAFYHGILKEIPELHQLDLDGEPSSTLRLN